MMPATVKWSEGTTFTHVQTSKANTVKVLTINMSVQCTIFAAILEV